MQCSGERGRAVWCSKEEGSAVQCSDVRCIAGDQGGEVASYTSLSPLSMRQGCTIGGKPSNPKYKHTELC